MEDNLSKIGIDIWKIKHTAALFELDQQERANQIEKSARIVKDCKDMINVETTFAELFELSEEQRDQLIQNAVDILKALKIPEYQDW